MSNDSRSLRRLPFPENENSKPLSKVLVMLALAFVMSSVGGATPVQAFPLADKTITHFELQTSPLPSPACAHSHYTLSFAVSAESIAELGGDTLNLDGGVSPSGITINGSSSSNAIAEVSPNTVSATAADSLIGRSAVFDLQTHDTIGSAMLTFEVAIKWAGQSQSIGPVTIPITVVHCKYKVVLMSIVTGGFSGTIETVAYRVTGEISEDTPGALKG